jgi:hypothetical protein
MEDLRHRARTEDEIQKQLRRFKTFSEDIQMEFRLENCANTTEKGKANSCAELSISYRERQETASKRRNVHIPRDREM